MTRATALLAAIFSLAPIAAAQTARPPNVVFVLIDDMGYGDLSCYDAKAAPTPRIDRVAREGIRFTSYYSGAPICSPSRAALLTGQYPQRWRVTSYIAAREENARRGIADWLDPAAPSVARSLKAAGYATGHFGKWHLGGGRDVGDAPLITDYGFDESLTQFEGLGDRLLPEFSKHDGAPTTRPGLAVASARLGRGKVEWADRSEMTSRYADRAIAFIDRAAKENKPFFVNVWLDDVHSPFFPPKALRNDESKRALYRSVVRATDQQLTKLFDHLAGTPALRDNTLLIIASDNGPEAGAGVAGPFKGSKGQLYEGGLREPFIVWGPGVIDAKAAGSVDDRSVIAGIDLAPTLLALANAKPTATLDGVDASDAITGRRPLDRQTPIFWRRPPERPGPPRNPLPDLAIRDGRYKFYCMADGTSPQLYDVVADPGETTDLAAKESALVEKYRKLALDWNAPLPKDKPERQRPTTADDNNG